MTQHFLVQLQQHLPFTVLKLIDSHFDSPFKYSVATAPTVYGIETYWIAVITFHTIFKVATAPTVYGIETIHRNGGTMGSLLGCNSTYRLRY